MKEHKCLCKECDKHIGSVWETESNLDRVRSGKKPCTSIFKFSCGRCTHSKDLKVEGSCSLSATKTVSCEISSIDPKEVMTYNVKVKHRT